MQNLLSGYAKIPLIQFVRFDNNFFHLFFHDPKMFSENGNSCAKSSDYYQMENDVKRIQTARKNTRNNNYDFVYCTVLGRFKIFAKISQVLLTVLNFCNI